MTRGQTPTEAVLFAAELIAGKDRYILIGTDVTVQCISRKATIAVTLTAQIRFLTTARVYIAQSINKKEEADASS